MYIYTGHHSVISVWEKKKVEQDFSKSLGLEKFISEVIVKSLVGELPKREKAFVKLRGIFVRYPSVGR